MLRVLTGWCFRGRRDSWGRRRCGGSGRFIQIGGYDIVVGDKLHVIVYVAGRRAVYSDGLFVRFAMVIVGSGYDVVVYGTGSGRVPGHDN